MNRRDFLRNVVASAVPAAVGLVVAGCQKAGLVRSPPLPYFGPRTGGPSALAQAPSGSGLGQRVATGPSIWVPAGSERPWQYIVLHHSATDHGSAAVFDRMHRNHGWDELGYHFVIGNGTESGNGEVEIGSRWPKQKHGAHCKVAGHPEYNDVGIGVCLVGNFDATRPTQAQIDSCVEVVQFLKDRYRVPRGRMYGHGQLKPTACPGRNFPYDEIYSRLA
ncbi:MAG TPA: peptidoglycan recognition family protein [Phycisphaerae bacterium]|nr:peptidoglycan recognition family protein [Phycisphaerae bacterium]